MLDIVSRLSRRFAVTGMIGLLLCATGLRRTHAADDGQTPTRDVARIQHASYDELLVDTLQEAYLLKRRNQELEHLVDALNEKALAAQDAAVRVRARSAAGSARRQIAVCQDGLAEAQKTIDRYKTSNAQLQRELKAASHTLSRTREALSEQQDRTTALALRSARREDELTAVVSRLRGLLKTHPAEWIMLSIDPELSDERQFILAGSINNAAVYYAAQGKLDQAESMHTEALALLEDVLGPKHETVGDCASNLGRLYYSRQRYREAEAIYRQTLTIYEHALGSDDVKVAVTLNHLACTCSALGNPTEAEGMYRRALAILERGPKAARKHVAAVLNNQALLHIAQEEYAAAEATLSKAIAHLETTRGKNDPGLFTILQNMAALYERTGRVALSFRYRQRAARLM